MSAWGASLAREEINTIRTDSFVHEWFKSLFEQLVDEGYLISWNLYDRQYRKREKHLVLDYKAIVACKEQYEVVFSFTVDLGESIFKFSETSNTTVCSRINVPANGNFQTLSSIMRNRIAGWQLGKDNQIRFESFLESVREHCPRVISCHKTSKHDDINNGIDFTVRFLAKPDWDMKEVSFNLKSSKMYIDHHKAKYPNVSTFIFKKEYLYTSSILRLRFLKFLLLAAESKQPIHM